MLELPSQFIERMKNRLPGEEFDLFLKAYEDENLPTIRINPKKEISVFEELSPIPWNPWGKILPKKKRYITDPLWHAGAYYVQESSSMILTEIFRQIYSEEKPERVLDLCAAPGGKSTLLQTLIDEEALIVANEVIKTRAQILKENHIRLGLSPNIIITQNDPKDFSGLEEFFDYIQIDTPCSGEGMFRKDESALREWSEANCQLCTERSKRILADVLPALAKDGYLVYSTCTFNPKENEELIQWACKTFELESIPLYFNPEWGISEVEYQEVHGYYFYPHKVKGEGLFISVLKKINGFGKAGLMTPKKIKPISIPNIQESENLVEEKGNLIWETPKLRAAKQELKNHLNILYSGIELGEQKGKDFIPAQALANYHQKLHNFPSVEVSEAQALEFLRGNDPDLDLNQRGIYLITYQNLGLGWVKFLGNRSNNYYPKPWRIKNY